MKKDDSMELADAKDLDEAVEGLRKCSPHFEPIMFPVILKNGDRGIIAKQNVPGFYKGNINRLILLKTKKDARDFAYMCKKCRSANLKFDLNSPYASCVFKYQDREFESPEELEEYLASDEVKEQEARVKERDEKIKSLKTLRKEALYGKETESEYAVRYYLTTVKEMLKEVEEKGKPLDMERMEKACQNLDEVFIKPEEELEDIDSESHSDVRNAISSKVSTEISRIEYRMAKEKIEVYKELISKGKKKEIKARWQEIDARCDKEIQDVVSRRTKIEELERWVFVNLRECAYNKKILDPLFEAYSLPFFSDERINKLSMIREYVTFEMQKREEEEQRQKEENERKYFEEKENRPDVKTLKSLRQQYKEHITREQEDAIIIHRSGLFSFFSEISSIEGYKTKTAEELWEILKSKKLFELVGNSGPFERLIRYREQHKNDKDDKLLNIINKVIPENCKQIKFGKNPDDNFMRELIENIKTQLDILESIPKDALVLPQDVVTYRGIQVGDDEVSPTKPSKGLLMSTSLNLENAQQFNAKDILFKLHLKKGTPVIYTPYFISTDEFGNISLVERTFEADLRTNEVTVNMGDIKSVSEIGRTTGYAYGFEKRTEDEDGIMVIRGDKPHTGPQVIAYECETEPTRTYEIRTKEEAER